jgi:hypothetical protein
MIAVRTITNLLPLLLLSSSVYSWVVPSTKQARANGYNVQSYPRFAVKDVDGSSKTIDNKALKDVINKALDQDDNRNIPFLQEWAIGQGVQIADGVTFVDNGLGDWGVGLNQSHAKGTSVMTIPSDLILSSESPELQKYRDSLQTSMNGGMEFYVPECLLILRVLEEKSKGESSRWQPWLETLPRSFSTGLFFEEIERAQAERLAPEFLIQQDLQWNACFAAIRKLLDDGLLSDNMTTFLKKAQISDGDDDDEPADTLDSLIRWAFSVVFTRSWRTASGLEATLVPLGDMFNHDSKNANVAPRPFSDDGSIQLSLKEDTDVGADLFITYGLSSFPGRFLILFGFWDRSSFFMDANLTIPEEFVVDRSQLVVSTRNGAITEDVWNLAVYNILSQRDPAKAAQMAEAQRTQDETTIQKFSSEWGLEAALYLRLHVLRTIGETYPGMRQADVY